jgi:DnaJ-class molecular chaperone
VDQDYDAQEDSLCGTCNGSGEGMHSDSTCGSCKGSGVERDDSGYEDHMAEKADYLNDVARDERLVT